MGDASKMTADREIVSPFDRKRIDRLAVVVVGLTILLVARIVQSMPTMPALAVVDVCCLTLAWRFWDLARRGILAGAAYERSVVAVATALTASFAVTMFVQSAPEQTAGVVGLLAIAVTLLTTPAMFAWLAGLSSCVWLAGGAAALSLPQMIGNGSAVAFAGLFGWFYVRRRSERITEDGEKAAEMRLAEERESLQRARLMLALEGGRVGHWYWDLKSDQLYVSDHWVQELGYERSDMTGSPDDWFARVHPYYLGELRQALAAHLYGNTDQLDCEYRIQHRDGTYRWAMVKGAAERNDKGEATGIAGVQSDVSELVNTESRVLNEALSDKLTGLPNRRAFMVRLERSVEKLRRNSSTLFAVVFFDLDRFKVVNDSMGHLVGDKLLAAVAKRLRGCQKQGDVVARFGGDEFVALLENLREHEDALNIAKRFQDALSRPFSVEDQQVFSGASIGIAFSNPGIEKAEDLLRNADAAMYHAKTTRKGDFAVFNNEMLSRATHLCQLQNDLAGALEREELRLNYQPVFSLKTKRIVSAEALLRWRRHDSEIVQPADFITVAEDMGLIEGFGEWVLRRGCSQVSDWRRQGLRPIKMAMNLSAKQLKRTDFDQLVREILSDTGLASDAIELELTESALIDSIESAPGVLGNLRASGIDVSIDDFGTGYSSLSYLRQFDFRSLKMDRSFVQSLTETEKSAAVARGLIGLAHNLDLSVTAEGVESTAQLEFLDGEGCDQVQGYLVSRPLEPETFERLLRIDATLEEMQEDPHLRSLVSNDPSVLKAERAEEETVELPAYSRLRGD